MQTGLEIRNLFRLADGLTVLACVRSEIETKWENKEVALVSSDGKIRQIIKINGERLMLRQTKNEGIFALDTNDVVNLSAEEAQSGAWHISIAI